MLNGKDISRTCRSRSAARRPSATCRWCSRTRSTRSTRATRSAAQIARVIAEVRRREATRRRCASAVFELLDTGQAAARLLLPPAAPAVGRPEAAGRHRPRLRRQPEGGDRRRAGLGARRLGAGGGHPAADGDPAREPHDAAVHQPRPVAGALSRRPRRRDVSRPDHGAGHDRRGVLRRPTIPTPRRCSRRCRSPTPRCARSTSCSRARSPRRSIRRRGCPFQTRCHRKIGRICETEAPPIARVRRAATRSSATCRPTSCWRMEPVIVLADREAAD